MVEFLDSFKLLKLNREEANDLSRLMTNEEGNWTSNKKFFRPRWIQSIILPEFQRTTTHPQALKKTKPWMQKYSTT